jgi:hypothetical protein
MLFVVVIVSSAAGADTSQDFTAIFPPPNNTVPPLLTIGNTAIIAGWDGQAMRLTPQQNDLNNNGLALNQLVSGPYDELQFDFQLRFSRGAGGADGIGFSYANSATFGADNASDFPMEGWGIGEEPNLIDSSPCISMAHWSNRSELTTPKFHRWRRATHLMPVSKLSLKRVAVPMSRYRSETP